jgi:hypothetical protein
VRHKLTAKLTHCKHKIALYVSFFAVTTFYERQGNARTRYEFGVKVSITLNNARADGGWFARPSR